MLDMTGLDDGFPGKGEIPKCSDTLVCKWRVYQNTWDKTYWNAWIQTASCQHMHKNSPLYEQSVSHENGYPLKSRASAACSDLNALTP